MHLVGLGGDGVERQRREQEAGELAVCALDRLDEDRRHLFRRLTEERLRDDRRARGDGLLEIRAVAALQVLALIVDAVAVERRELHFRVGLVVALQLRERCDDGLLVARREDIVVAAGAQRQHGAVDFRLDGLRRLQADRARDRVGIVVERRARAVVAEARHGDEADDEERQQDDEELRPDLCELHHETPFPIQSPAQRKRRSRGSAAASHPYAQFCVSLERKRFPCAFLLSF